MKKIIAVMTILAFSPFALAESAWSTDSCYESMAREFTCEVAGKKIEVDLEDLNANQISAKAPEKGWQKIFGLVIKNIEGGQLYITCDDAETLENVKFEKDDTATEVSCEIKE